jgi:hypothetical protein
MLSITLLNRPFAPLDRSVDNLLSRIRKTIEPHMAGKPVIRSVRGRGYVFVGFDEQPGDEQPGDVQRGDAQRGDAPPDEDAAIAG